MGTTHGVWHESELHARECDFSIHMFKKSRKGDWYIDCEFKFSRVRNKKDGSMHIEYKSQDYTEGLVPYNWGVNCVPNSEHGVWSQEDSRAIWDGLMRSDPRGCDDSEMIAFDNRLRWMGKVIHGPTKIPMATFWSLVRKQRDVEGLFQISPTTWVDHRRWDDEITTEMQKIAHDWAAKKWDECIYE